MSHIQLNKIDEKTLKETQKIIEEWQRQHQSPELKRLEYWQKKRLAETLRRIRERFPE